MSFPIYETRLRDIIGKLCKLSSLDLTLQWTKDLGEHDVEFWANAVSSGTSDQVKALSSKDEPPTEDDFEDLPLALPGDYRPGAYLGRAFGNCLYSYVGSATRVGRGLGSRTGQHKNSEYREKELKKQTFSMFYNVLQGSDTELIFYVLFAMDWISSSAADITLTRLICVLTEQVYMLWLGSYEQRTAKGPQKKLARLGPWPIDAFPYFGTNIASPVRNDIMRAEKDAEAMTPKELNKRTADIARERKKNWTQEELEEAQAKRHDYHRRVANPVRRFKDKAKKQHLSLSTVNERIKAFRKADKEAIKAGKPAVNPEDYLILD